jgi:hypothetical protein
MKAPIAAGVSFNGPEDAILQPTKKNTARNKLNNKKRSR